MSVLKFKLLAEVVTREIDISDNVGNIISIPSKGVSDYQEYKQAMGRILKAQNNPNAAAGIEIEIVLVCLRYRFSIDSKISDEEILQLDNGESMNVSMIQKLFRFFANELGIEGLAPKQSGQMEDATPYVDQSKNEGTKGFKKSKLLH
ncbi:hypothetical protein [Microcoleus sp. B3-D7]|uniref:hypothetical protein n=1 Tax=Microcoleus sp. B3-D7 TaxID=2818659 RepID=UPI002FD381D6